MHFCNYLHLSMTLTMQQKWQRPNSYKSLESVLTMIITLCSLQLVFCIDGKYCGRVVGVLVYCIWNV